MTAGQTNDPAFPHSFDLFMSKKLSFVLYILIYLMTVPDVKITMLTQPFFVHH